jgi:hypothetical protein
MKSALQADVQHQKSVLTRSKQVKTQSTKPHPFADILINESYGPMISHEWTISN